MLVLGHRRRPWEMAPGPSNVEIFDDVEKAGSVAGERIRKMPDGDVFKEEWEARNCRQKMWTTILPCYSPGEAVDIRLMIP